MRIFRSLILLFLLLPACSNMLDNHPFDNRLLYAAFKSYFTIFNIQDDIPVTYSLQTSLHSTVTDAVTMRFRNEGVLGWTDYTYAREIESWLLPMGTGIKGVYAEYYDINGDLICQLYDEIQYIEHLAWTDEEDTIRGFGWSLDVSSDGNVIVVGTNNEDDDVPVFFNSANIYEWNGLEWIRTTLDIPFEVPGDGDTDKKYGKYKFGYDVSVSGNGEVVAVSAVEYCIVNGDGECVVENNGAVYTYQKNAQDEWDRITDTGLYGDEEEGQRFGTSIALSPEGTILAVGAPGKNNGMGAVYIYKRDNDNWVLDNDCIIGNTPSGPNEDEKLGLSVAISGLIGPNQYILVAGAPWYIDPNMTFPKCFGAAYMYTLTVPSDWPVSPIIITPFDSNPIHANDSAEEDRFGSDVAISIDGNYIVVGSPFSDIGLFGENIGAAYLFARSGLNWSETSKLFASDGERSDGFGKRVDISGNGDTIIIGAPDDDLSPLWIDADKGSAYIITGGTQEKLTAIDGLSGDQFGSAVALSEDGSIRIVGAYMRTLTRDDEDAGSVYIFR